MVALNRRHFQPIGLDVGHDSVKMIQFEVADHALVVHSAHRRVLESSSASTTPSSENGFLAPQAAQIIREMLHDGEFHGRNVIAALPRQIVHVKNLRLPQMPTNELASVVKFEARNLFTFDPEEGHIDFLSAGEVRQGSEVRQEVIVLGARWIDIDHFLEQLHGTGAVVDSLDVEPCGLYRGVARFVRRREDEQEIHVLIDCGMHRTQVLIGKGRDVSFFKIIEIGGARFNEAVSRKLGITVEEARAVRRRLNVANSSEASPDPVRRAVFDATRSTMEDLTKEISLCLRYYSVTFRGQRPAKVRLLGGEAYDPQFVSILNAALNVTVQAGRPLFNMNCDRMKSFDNKGPSAEWALAVGLGLKRTTGPFVPLDGTPRISRAAVVSDVSDLNGLGNPVIAPPKDAAALGDHFAAVRRASSTEEATNA